MYLYDFSRLASEDIDKTYDYIAVEKEAPKAAQNLMAELGQKIEYLMEFPLRRPFVHEPMLALMGFRSIKVKNHVLYYVVDEERNYIKIIRFLYSKRDWINILLDNPSGD
jgi:plasmid stabilization system protein ParE